MAINFGAGFNIAKAEAVDSKMYLTKAQMLVQDDNIMPSVYFAVCPDDGKFYLYNKANSKDPATGKFRVLEGSGSAKIDKWVSKKNYNPDDLVVYNNAIFQCKITNNDTVFDDTKWVSLAGDKLFEVIEKTTIDIDTDLQEGNFIVKGKVEGVTLDELVNIHKDTNICIITTLGGRVVKFDKTTGTYAKTEDKFITAKEVHDELYTTVPKVPMYYKLAEKQDGTEGLIIVTDGTLTDGNTQVEESTVNSNKADGDLTVYTVGQYMLKIEEVPEHDVTTYMPRTETYTKTEVDEKIGEAECSTTEELEIYGVEDLFGIPDGTKIPEKTLHMELFKKIFQKIIHPTYVSPVLKVVADKVLVEKGVATDVVLTPTFTKNDAGNVNTVTVYKDNVQVDTQATTSVSPYTLSVVNLTAEATYKYEVAYDEGAVKKNNKGDDDRTGIIEAGTIFKEVKIKPVLATYVGVVDNGNVDETNIVANCEKLIRENTTLTKKVSPVFQTVVFATTGTLTSIINQNNYEVLSSFTKTVVSIGGENYNVYALENINVNNFAYTFKF